MLLGHCDFFHACTICLFKLGWTCLSLQIFFMVKTFPFFSSIFWGDAQYTIICSHLTMQQLIRTVYAFLIPVTFTLIFSSFPQTLEATFPFQVLSGKSFKVLDSYMNIHIFLIHFSVGGLVDCFHPLTL